MDGWMGGAAERYCALVAGFGFLEGEGASGRFCRRWVLGGCGGWGTFLLVAFWRGRAVLLARVWGIAVDGWVDDLGIIVIG